MDDDTVGTWNCPVAGCDYLCVVSGSKKFIEEVGAGCVIPALLEHLRDVHKDAEVAKLWHRDYYRLFAMWWPPDRIEPMQTPADPALGKPVGEPPANQHLLGRRD